MLCILVNLQGTIGMKLPKSLDVWLAFPDQRNLVQRHGVAGHVELQSSRRECCPCVFEATAQIYSLWPRNKQARHRLDTTIQNL